MKMALSQLLRSAKFANAQLAPNALSAAHAIVVTVIADAIATAEIHAVITVSHTAAAEQ
jgi:hypothetical protein